MHGAIRKIMKSFEVSYVYWTVHHLYSCVKRKNQLDATYFIIYSIVETVKNC